MPRVISLVLILLATLVAARALAAQATTVTLQGMITRCPRISSVTFPGIEMRSSSSAVRRAETLTLCNIPWKISRLHQ